MSTSANPLSAQDMQDLQAIRSQLPAGDPRVAKINALVSQYSSQPTQFEQKNTPVPQSQQSTYDKLTAPTSPGVQEFASKHPILGPVVRGLDAAGGAVMGFPGGVARSIAHPIDTANSVAQSIEDWTTKPKQTLELDAPSVLPEALYRFKASGECSGG